jgi:hypothetical protein
MIITELDKAWCRAATADLIRQGKLKRQPCAVCGGRETLVHHIDYSHPERVTWLCKRHKSEAHMSDLQRSLLRDGLLAYYRRPLDIACQLPDVGSFRLQALMMQYEDRRVRASRHAAAGLSIARLIKRGLLECCTRGRWRLTPAGLAVARRLNPQCKPPTKRELAADIALRKAICRFEDEHSARAGKRHRRRSQPPAGITIADFQRERPGVDVKLDLCGNLTGQNQPIPAVLTPPVDC